MTLVRGAKATPKGKDLSSRKEVKGGGKRLNDNVTLVRAAKPAPKKRDCVGKDVKGGQEGCLESVHKRRREMKPTKTASKKAKDLEGAVGPGRRRGSSGGARAHTTPRSSSNHAER
jgi:hypothetical protein